MKTHSPNGKPYVQPTLYAVRLSAEAVEIVQLERGAPPTYVQSVRHGLVREARHATAGAAFAAAKHLAGWNRRGCDGVERVIERAPRKSDAPPS